MANLPHNLDAEQALLGALLFDNNQARHISPDLRAEHFFDPVHGRIFAVIQEAIRDGKLAEFKTLKARFENDATLKDIGGASYLLKLMEAAAPLTVQTQAYADLIVDLSLRRGIVTACRDAAMAVLNPTDGSNAEDMLLEAQRALAALGSDSSTEEAWRSAGEIAAAAVERAYEGKAKGIPTGLPKLDEFTGGGRPGTMWVLGGATSMGKSVGGQQLAVNVARKGLGVAYVHLEMDHEEVGIRLASGLAWDFKRINQIGEAANPYYLSAVNQKLKPDQWERMRDAAKRVAPTLKIYVDDRPGRTVSQIEASTMRLFQKMRREGIAPGLVVVDHEGLIAPEGKHASELEAARARAHGLKNMAKRLGVWTLVLSQITKEGARADGEDRLPTSLDLNYGSALSQAAHVVILLHRKAYYAERKPHASRTEHDVRMATSRETQLIVDKARGGRRGRIDAIMDVASAVLIEDENA